MENTIIINKAIIHELDIEHSQVHFSSELSTSGTMLDYLQTKIDKTIKSTNLKEVFLGQHHEIFEHAKIIIDSINNESDFVKESQIVTKKIYNLASQIETMPNGIVAVCDARVNGEHLAFVIKINYKMKETVVNDEGVLKIQYVQSLPTSGSAVDEAIVIDKKQGKCYLIEKKFEIDGKKDFYLNPQWLKGETSLTDKEKIKYTKKVIKQMDETYKATDKGAMAYIKQILFEKRLNNEDINPIELAKEVLKNDYQAESEAEVILSDLGINESSVIKSVDGKLDSCKIKINDNIYIVMSVDDYLCGDYIKKENNNGETNIVIPNIWQMLVE